MQYTQMREFSGMDQTKLAPCHHGSTAREADTSLSVSAGPTVDALESSEIEEPTSAVEAVRYLFLAKELRRLGQAPAADRWQAKAIAWLARLDLPSSQE